VNDLFVPLALPQLTMFDEAQCEQIHLASLEILRRTGVRVHQDEASATATWLRYRRRWQSGH
jgi:trimethylamine:corrinoid methyltransferase-like protein